jgi:hypothetical protein
MYLERPEGMDLDDAEGIAAVDEAVPIMNAEEIVPRLQDFATVGHLYRSIESGFGHLVDKLGADRVFIGPPQAQITQANFDWPQLVPITDLGSATAAIAAIVEQGEGPRGDWRQAHFGRFRNVLEEFLAQRQLDPAFEPARPVAAATVRLGERDSGGLLISDPVTAKVADLGNVVYEVLLQVLYRLLSRIDESDAETATLADVAVGLMVDGIEPVAKVLTTLPIGPGSPGVTAGIPFELFYEPDYLLPHRRAAWLLMGERLAESAALAAHLSDTVPVLTSIAADLSRLSDKISTGANSSEN